MTALADPRSMRGASRKEKSLTASEQQRLPRSSMDDQLLAITARVNPLSVEQRWHRIESLVITYVHEPSFATSSARVWLHPVVVESAEHSKGSFSRRGNNLDGLSQDLAAVCATPLLCPEQEAQLFHRMNYLKYRAVRLRDRLLKGRRTAEKLDEFDWFWAEAAETRNVLIHSNTRLVVALAKKYVSSHQGFDELFSEGMVSLMKAVDKFNCSFGYRFSTYATTAVKNNFHHSIKGRQRDAYRFSTGTEKMLGTLSDHRPGDDIQDREMAEFQSAVSRFMRQLTSLKRTVFEARFGFTADGTTETLRELSKRLRLSRERIRQIQVETVQELKDWSAAHAIGIPEPT